VKERTGQRRNVHTGGPGRFIGSHVVEALVAADWRVRCFVRYSSRGLSASGLFWTHLAGAIVMPEAQR